MTDGAALCEELPWDSGFFGVSIARAIPSQVDDRTCDAMLDWCRSRRIDCLYFLCPLEATATQRQLSDAGFQQMGVRVTLTRSAGSGAGVVTGRTRLAIPDDVPTLREIALSSHRDNRFHADNNFDPARCDELYATWIENSVRGYADYVLVAERDDGPVGYLTIHINQPDMATPAAQPTARLGLMAVDERWRGQGIGRDFMRTAAQTLAAHGVAETLVVTAGNSVVALKLYEREGFRTTDVSLWYHRWFRDGRR